MAEKTTTETPEVQALQSILEAIVDNPGEVIVEREVDEMGVVLKVLVAPADMPIVIGKQGSTINAIREVIRIIGFRHRARVSIKLEEPERQTVDNPVYRQPPKKLRKDLLENLI